MNADRAAFALYRADLQARAALTAEEEQVLSRAYRQGDRRAGQRLVEGCLPFVMTIALEYRRWGIPLEDIVQEGNIGLLKAAERFDPDRGCRLATYAAYWIRAEIREYVVRGYRIVRLGSTKSERRALRAYRTMRDRDEASIAEASGLSVERTRELLPLLAARDVSLDRASTDDSPSPSERMASGADSPEEQVSTREQSSRMSEALQTVVAELSPRERQIIEARWLSEEPVTLEALGAGFGVSKERVRQLEERAKRRMKARLEELTAEPAVA